MTHLASGENANAITLRVCPCDKDMDVRDGAVVESIS